MYVGILRSKPNCSSYFGLYIYLLLRRTTKYAKKQEEKMLHDTYCLLGLFYPVISDHISVLCLLLSNLFR